MGNYNDCDSLATRPTGNYNGCDSLATRPCPENPRLNQHQDPAFVVVAAESVIEREHSAMDEHVSASEMERMAFASGIVIAQDKPVPDGDTNYRPQGWAAGIAEHQRLSDLLVPVLPDMSCVSDADSGGRYDMGHYDMTLENGASASGSRLRPSVGIPVYVHVYDLTGHTGVQQVNDCLAAEDSPFKFGGIFHAGVEVNELEWSYGLSSSKSSAGISCIEPKRHAIHHYRQTVTLGNTKLRPEEIADLLTLLIEEYPGSDYNLLERNCCHFADEFCKRLGVGRLPGWIYRLAHVAALADKTLQAVIGRKFLVVDDDRGKTIQHSSEEIPEIILSEAAKSIVKEHSSAQKESGET